MIDKPKQFKSLSTAFEDGECTKDNIIGRVIADYHCKSYLVIVERAHDSPYGYIGYKAILILSIERYNNPYEYINKVGISIPGKWFLVL